VQQKNGTHRDVNLEEILVLVVVHLHIGIRARRLGLIHLLHRHDAPDPRDPQLEMRFAVRRLLGRLNSPES